MKYPCPEYPGVGTYCAGDSTCFLFGTCCAADLGIGSDSNNNSNNYCRANGYFKLPAAKGKGFYQRNSSIDGGNDNFRCKEFEVY